MNYCILSFNGAAYDYAQHRLVQRTLMEMLPAYLSFGQIIGGKDPVGAAKGHGELRLEYEGDQNTLHDLVKSVLQKLYGDGNFSLPQSFEKDKLRLYYDRLEITLS